jgi:hypothetical protein
METELNKYFSNMVNKFEYVHGLQACDTLIKLKLVKTFQ